MGTVFFPNSRKTTLPVVINCHGWAAGDWKRYQDGKNVSSPTDTLDGLHEKLMLYLVSHDIAFVNFHFFGKGETVDRYPEVTYGRWTNNLHDIISWTKQQSWAIPDRIGCIGTSSGTYPVLKVAQSDDKIAFGISIATFMGHYAWMPNSPGKVLSDNWDTLIKGGSATWTQVPFKSDFFLDVLKNAPIYTMEKTSCPVYFLTGGADNMYRRADAWLGWKLLQKLGLPVEHKIIEEGNHGLSNVAGEALHHIVDWLKSIRFFEEV